MLHVWHIASCIKIRHPYWLMDLWTARAVSTCNGRLWWTFFEKIFTHHHMLMKTILLSLIISNYIPDIPPDEMLKMLGQVVDSIHSRHSVMMKETIVMSVIGCVIKCFQRPTATCIVVSYKTSPGYDLELQRPSLHDSFHLWNIWVWYIVCILQ